MQGTVAAARGVVFTTDAQIKSSNESSSPRLGTNLPFEIGDASLEGLADIYNELSGGAYEKQARSLLRFQENHRTGCLELPFVWAIDKIRERMAAGVLDFDDAATNIALGRIYAFNHMYRVWSHHPRFKVIVREFANPSSFFHTVSQLLMAEYLFQHGNRVGFSVPEVQGTATPDLYIRFGSSEKFYIEIKSPECLMWRDGFRYSAPEMAKKISSIIKKTNQINKRRHGIIAIVSTILTPSVSRDLESRISSTLSFRGRDAKYLAGAVAMQWGEIHRSIRSKCPIQKGVSDFSRL